MQPEVGAVLEGKVSGVTKFGAFVNLPGDKSGLVHISEIANTFVSDVAQYVSVGQTVKVKVIGIDPAGKISLSIKRAVENPAPAQQRPQQSQQPPRSSYNNNGGNRGPRDFSQPRQQDSGSKGFEDMLSKFMQRSDEKISDLRKSVDGKRGSYQKRSH